jgi:hypothetical protein
MAVGRAGRCRVSPVRGCARLRGSRGCVAGGGAARVLPEVAVLVTESEALGGGRACCCVTAGLEIAAGNGWCSSSRSGTGRRVCWARQVLPWRAEGSEPGR